MDPNPESVVELDPTYGGRFAPGDTIAIVLPEPGLVIATIGRLTPERMLVTTFGPALSRVDSAAILAWRPEGWSSWVVDTVGLRDGTYAKIPAPPGMALAKDVDVVTLPRFKAVAKGGQRVLAEYDPETLFIRAMIDSDDSPEFRDAPSVVPQDPTTFEVALSLNVGFDTELPDGATLEQMNKSRFVIAILSGRMSRHSYYQRAASSVRPKFGLGFVRGSPIQAFVKSRASCSGSPRHRTARTTASVRWPFRGNHSVTLSPLVKRQTNPPASDNGR
jgi:hypothetical protein